MAPIAWINVNIFWLRLHAEDAFSFLKFAEGSHQLGSCTWRCLRVKGSVVCKFLQVLSLTESG